MADMKFWVNGLFTKSLTSGELAKKFAKGTVNLMVNINAVLKHNRETISFVAPLLMPITTLSTKMTNIKKSNPFQLLIF